MGVVGERHMFLLLAVIGTLIYFFGLVKTAAAFVILWLVFKFIVALET